MSKENEWLAIQVLFDNYIDALEAKCGKELPEQRKFCEQWVKRHVYKEELETQT
jgi:hypothetical protein